MLNALSIAHVETAVALRAMDAREATAEARAAWLAASRAVGAHIIGAPEWSGCPACNRGGRACLDRVNLDDDELVAWGQYAALRRQEEATCTPTST